MDMNEEQVAFYFELGLAISQWAHVELALAQVAASCTHSHSRKAIRAGLQQLDSFRARLAFVDGVADNKITETRRRTEWARLYAKASALSKTRNKLAHNMVIIYGRSKVGRRWVIASDDAPKRDLLKKPKPGVAPSNAIGVRDIIAFRHDAVALMCALMNLSSRLARRPLPFPRPFAPPEHPPTTNEIANQMRAMLPLRPQPSQE